MNIVKTFVEVYVLDMEGRRGDWEATNKTYEEAINGMDNWTIMARIVEKTFDPETFIITEREVKRTEKVYDGWQWNGKIKEIINEWTLYIFLTAARPRNLRNLYTQTYWQLRQCML